MNSREREVDPTRITSQRTEGPTPHGGAFAIIYYLDDDFRLTTKDVATRFEIEECDADGSAIFHTRGSLTGNLDDY